MKANHTYKKHALATLVGGALLAMSANALALGTDTVLTFDFTGQFTMTNPDGTVVPNATPAVAGTMMLDTFTMGGSASMTGVYFNYPWTANGAFSAYTANPLVPNLCGGAPMCAHADIDFLYVGVYYKVPAAFGMTPSGDLSSLSVADIGSFNFSVASIDTEPDGIMGTAMTDDYAYKKKDGSAVPNLFKGFTPAFTGVATLTNINPLGDRINNSNIYIAPVPEPSEWAMMLVGLGVVGTLARTRRRS